MKKLTQLKTSEINSLKEKWWLEQNKKCPLLNKEIELSSMVIDHQHKLKSELADITGKGICRGAISRFGNALEGKISNNFKRMGLDKHINLPSFLRNLADYLENNHIHNDYELFIHPTEAEKPKYIKKSCYNKLAKVYDMKAKLPEFKDKMKLSQKLESLFKKYNIEIEYY